MWIKHPRSGSPDTMLTVAMVATGAAILKFLLNGMSIGSINLGTVDASLLGALLVPTLGAYVTRKFKDSPDQKGTKK